MREYIPRPAENEAPYVIAHRGISAKAPENTLAAFQRAAETQGIDMIELDVRLSKDEEVIVFHDRTLQRTTTGNGAARAYTLSELKEFDAGSWFHPAFSNERIPTLYEVCETVGKKLWINIEIKSDIFHREPEGLLERRVLEVLCECEMLHRVLISSFDHSLLARLKKIEPRCTTGVLYNLYSDFLFSPSALVQRVGAEVFVCAKHELWSWMLKDAHKNGIAVYVYTLDSLQHAERLKERGVDGIMSNRADDIVSVVKGIKSEREA